METDILSSPSLPTLSDPALYDDWEEGKSGLFSEPSSTISDELEALRQVHEEAVLKKNKEGIVIQHRAWDLGEAFRSEADYIEGLTHLYSVRITTEIFQIRH